VSHGRGGGRGGRWGGEPAAAEEAVPLLAGEGERSGMVRDGAEHAAVGGGQAGGEETSLERRVQKQRQLRQQEQQGAGRGEPRVGAEAAPAQGGREGRPAGSRQGFK